MENRTQYRTVRKPPALEIKAVSLRIPIELHAAVQVIAIEQKRSVNGQINLIVEEWLAQNQSEAE